MKVDSNNSYELQKYKCKISGTVPFNGSFILSGASIFNNTNYKVTNVTDSPTKLYKFDLNNGEIYLTAKFLNSNFLNTFMQNKIPENTFDYCKNNEGKDELALNSSSLNDNSDGAFDTYNGKIIFHAANIILYVLDENLKLVTVQDYKVKLTDDTIEEASNYGLQTVSASHPRHRTSLGESTFGLNGQEINYVARIGVTNILADFFHAQSTQYVQIFSRNLETLVRTKIMDLTTVEGAMHECVLLDDNYIIPVFSYNPNFFKAISNPVFNAFTWKNKVHFYKCNLTNKTVKKYTLNHAFGGFHIVNYFNQGTDIIIDVVSWRKPVDIVNIFTKIDNINNKIYPNTMLVRFTLKETGKVSSDILHEFDGFVEGFCIDETLRGKPYDCFYSLKNLNEIIKIDKIPNVEVTSLHGNTEGFCSQPAFNNDTIMFTTSNSDHSSLMGVDPTGKLVFEGIIPLNFPITFTNHSIFTDQFNTV